MEQAIDHRAAIEAQASDQRVPSVLESRPIEQTSRRLPANRLSLVEPHAQANPIDVLPFDRWSLAWLIVEDFDAGTHLLMMH